MGNWIENCKDRKYTEANWYWLHKEYKEKTNSSLFQSIYTSLLTNEIILKELNEKRKMKINFKGRTNRIGKGRKG
jgi:CTP:phosphocholine cytidylyltransferase-like protein